MRHDISFPSNGGTCRGWFYVPDGLRHGERLAAIVMAHGFSAVKEMYLPRFAERFVDAGFAVLVFDFRHIGASDGEPRGQVFPRDQHEDYRNAITYACRRTEIDPERVGLWGTSFSGGHVLHLAAFDRRIKAVVAQVPAVGVWKQLVRNGNGESLDGILGLLTIDRLARYDSGVVNTLKVVAPPGEACVLSTPDAYEWFSKAGEECPSWRNQVTLESLERMIEYHPADAIELISSRPLLVIAAEQDSLVPIELVREEFARAGEPKQLLELPCGHFDVYSTEPWFDRAADAATEWFSSQLS